MRIIAQLSPNRSTITRKGMRLDYHQSMKHFLIFSSAEDDAVIQLESTVEEARNEPQVALEYVTINNDIDDGSFSSPKSVNLEKGSLIVNFDEREEI